MWALWTCVLCVLAVGASTRAGLHNGVVTLKHQGAVRGSRAKNGDYWQFKGIPYATASQQNRFQSPLPVPRWNGVRDADLDVACVQVSELNNDVVGQEDCLVVNVYTPACEGSAEPLPVMVFVHGGGYNQGSGESFIYGPERFMKQNVILVTFNYRLGILGFLCTEDIANNGIKDSIAVLEWVKTNIASFGGDPTKVTIFGQSAGSSIVELILLSKRSRGLFSKAICQSGLSTAPWAFGSDPKEKARRVSEQLGYSGNDTNRRLQVLKNASLEDLTRATESLALMTPYEFLPVAPCVEPADREGAVVTLDPVAAIASNQYSDVPFMLGFTKDEAMLLYGLIPVDPDFFDKLNDNFIYSLPKDLQNVSAAGKISNDTKRFYFKDGKINNASMADAIKYFTDVTYGYESVRTVRRYLSSGKRAPMFLYEFAYDGGMPFLKLRLNISQVAGVCHADELGYMFTQTGYTLTRPRDLLLAERLILMWTNFAKFGEPTPQIRRSALLPTEWTPSSARLEYLLIDDTLDMQAKPFANRTDYWDSLYTKWAT